MKSNALIIEDDADAAYLLRLLLDRNGWCSEHARTVAEGRARAERHPFPEIILLDLQLPDSNVEQTLVEIPRLMRNGPVLVLSNFEIDGLRERIEGMGSFYARKKLDDVGTSAIFDAMLSAIRAWRNSMPQDARKKTDRIAVNLLEMQAILSKHAPR